MDAHPLHEWWADYSTDYRGEPTTKHRKEKLPQVTVTVLYIVQPFHNCSRLRTPLFFRQRCDFNVMARPSGGREERGKRGNASRNAWCTITCFRGYALPSPPPSIYSGQKTDKVVTVLPRGHITCVSCPPPPTRKKTRTVLRSGCKNNTYIF